MSTFEPMSEAALHEIAGNCATETSVLSRVVATALHHLARAKAAEEALAEHNSAAGILAGTRRLLGLGPKESIFDFVVELQKQHGAAVEARDLAIAERDEARSVLNAFPAETLPGAAERVASRLRDAHAARDAVMVERDDAYRQRDAAMDEGRAEPEGVSAAANMLSNAFLIDDITRAAFDVMDGAS